MSAQDNALKPCPFCGDTPAALAFAEGSTFRWLAWSCPSCGIGGEERVQTMGDGTPDQWLADAKVRATAAWNTRAAAPQQAAPAQPVARMHPDGRVVAESTYANGAESSGASWSSVKGYTIPLYASAQPMRQPLTDAQIEKAITDAVQAGRIPWMGFKRDDAGEYTLPSLSRVHYGIARVIERAHGIGDAA